MILDSASVLSSAQALTVTAVSTGVYDIVGLGVGVPSPNIFGQTFGQFTNQAQDLGGGGPLVSPPMVTVQVGAAFTAGGSATMQVSLQGAPDTSNTGTPGTWTDIVETGVIAVANLTAGALVMRLAIPPKAPGEAIPRFYRLNYTIATGPMLTGTMNAFLNTGADNTALYSSNF